MNKIKTLKQLPDLFLLVFSKLFDKKWYLENNTDIKKGLIYSHIHYLNYGGFEGRDPSPKFNSSWYLISYEDVKQTGINPLVHYLKYGREEGRSAQKPIDIRSVSNEWDRQLLPPDFLIVGAQKAGTTALYTYLAQHPSICATKVKEHHFFDCEKNYAKGKAYYQSLFPTKKKGRLHLMHLGDIWQMRNQQSESIPISPVFK